MSLPPDWAGREVAPRRAIESIVDGDRQITRGKWHCGWSGPLDAIALEMGERA